MVDSNLEEGGGSPLNLSFLKLDDTSFDPIQEWLLDCDQRPTPLHAMSDPSPVHSGGAQQPLVHEDKLGETVEVLKIGCKEEGLEKNLTESEVKTRSLGDGSCKEDESSDTDGARGSDSEDGTSDTESESTSSDEEEDDDAEEEDSHSKEDEAEEGEIKNSELEELIASSDDEGSGGNEPIKSRNEISGLPPVPPVDVVLAPHHQALPVGVISSIIGSQVIVDGLVNHNPLNEGSILWISETRSPLGLIDEIFGPVKKPYYVVRYNSADEVPSGIHEGTAVSFVAEYSNLILNQDDLRTRGYDASGENDEEIGDEVEFSDDEKEAEYKRMLRQSKRGMANERNFIPDSFNKKKNSSKCSGLDKRERHKGPPKEQSTGKSASHIPTKCQFPSISGGSDTVGATSGSTNSFGIARPTLPSTPQAMRSDGCFGGQTPNFLQHQNIVTWMPGVPIQQQNIRAPNLFGVNAPFHHPQQLQQTHPMFLQQQTFPGLPGGVSNGFPFQQQISSNLRAQFNPIPFDQLNSYISPMPLGPMGVASFGQPPFIYNNMNAGTVRMPSMTNDGQLFGSSAVPQNVPPMQFHIGASSTMGASTNCGIHHHPSNIRHPFGGHGHP